MPFNAVQCIFRLRHPEANQVFLVGSFNDWSTTAAPMRLIEPGRWETEITLPPGQHRYCYLSIAGPIAEGPDAHGVRIGLVNRVSVLTVPQGESVAHLN